MFVISIILLTLHILAFAVPIGLMCVWKTGDDKFGAVLLLLIFGSMSGGVYVVGASSYNNSLQQIKTVGYKISELEKTLSQNYSQLQHNSVNINRSDSAVVRVNEDTPIETTAKLITGYNKDLTSLRLKKATLLDDINWYRYGFMQYVTWGSDTKHIDKIEAELIGE